VVGCQLFVKNTQKYRHNVTEETKLMTLNITCDTGKEYQLHQADTIMQHDHAPQMHHLLPILSFYQIYFHIRHIMIKLGLEQEK